MLKSPKMFAVGAAMLMLVGCATNRIDWNSRVGTFNYDQAILELGPPDRVADLSDGVRVAEWMTRRGYSGGGMVIQSGPFFHGIADSPAPDRFLRLTFTPDGRLQDWRRIAR